MFRGEPLESWRAEHLAVRVVGLHEPLAVEQNAVPLSQKVTALFVAHAGHQAQGHSPRSELSCMFTTPQVRQVMPSVGVTEASALWIQESVEASDKHIGGDTDRQRLVDPPEYLARRVRSLGDGAQHAAGRGHNQGCRHAFARSIAHHEAEVAVFQLEEVVEVAPDLACGLVVGRYLPALEGGYLLRERGLLDAPRHQQLLLDLLALANLLLQALLGQPQDPTPLAPLLDDLAPCYPMNDDARRLILLTSRCYAHEFSPIVDAPYGEPAHYPVVRRHLILDDVAQLGEGPMVLGHRPLVAFAIRILTGKQAAVDEVICQYLIQGVQIPLALRLEEAPHQSHIFL